MTKKGSYCCKSSTKLRTYGFAPTIILHFSHHGGHFQMYVSSLSRFPALDARRPSISNSKPVSLSPPVSEQKLDTRRYMAGVYIARIEPSINQCVVNMWYTYTHTHPPFYSRWGGREKLSLCLTLKSLCPVSGHLPRDMICEALPSIGILDWLVVKPVVPLTN